MLNRIIPLVTLLLLAFPGQAEPIVKTQTAVFDITANGRAFGTMALDYRATATTYSLAVTAEATGLFGFLLRAQYDGQASGMISPDQGLVPLRFSAASERLFKRRNTEISFENNRPTQVTLTPKRDRTSLTDPSIITDTRTDPISLLAELFTWQSPGCPPPRRLYDGRRLSLVDISDATPSATGQTCRGSYQITQGPDHSLQSGKRRFGLAYHYEITANSQTLTGAEFTSGSTTILLTRRAE